jgi:hypothetical protein
MQNPFIRLKHYRTDQSANDARENHATEVPAACLVFSHRFRADFLNFVFLGKRTFSVDDAANMPELALAKERGPRTL